MEAVLELEEDSRDRADSLSPPRRRLIEQYTVGDLEGDGLLATLASQVDLLARHYALNPSDLQELHPDQYGPMPALREAGPLKWFGHLVGRIFGAISYVVVETGTAVTEALPPNWLPQAGFPDLRRAEGIILEEGLPLAWVPESNVLRAMLDADSTVARDTLLHVHEQSILRSCRHLMETLPTAELNAYCLDAIAAAEQGHWSAAQALATTVLDTSLGKRALAIRQQYKAGLAPKIRLNELRGVLTYSAMVVARENYNSASTQSLIPGIYNRNASVHAVGREQYTNRNSLVSLMLTCSIIAEQMQADSSFP